MTTPRLTEEPTPAEIRLARENLGLTTREMASHLEVQDRSLRRWEDGTRGIPARAVTRVNRVIARADREVEMQVRFLSAMSRERRVFVIPDPGTAAEGWPARWWGRVALRVVEQVPECRVQHWRDVPLVEGEVVL